MLNVKQFNNKKKTNKIQGPISDLFDPRWLFISALVPGFYCSSNQEVLTVWELLTDGILSLSDL